MTVDQCVIGLLTCACVLLGGYLLEARRALRTASIRAHVERVRLIAAERDRARRAFSQVMHAMLASGIASTNPRAWAEFIAEQERRVARALENDASKPN